MPSVKLSIFNVVLEVLGLWLLIILPRLSIIIKLSAMMFSVSPCCAKSPDFELLLTINLSNIKKYRKVRRHLRSFSKELFAERGSFYTIRFLNYLNNSIHLNFYFNIYLFFKDRKQYFIACLII